MMKIQNNMVEQTTTDAVINQPIATPDYQTLYEAFMKMDKETLAMLLAAKEMKTTNIPEYPFIPYFPQYPSPQLPWIIWYNTIC